MQGVDAVACSMGGVGVEKARAARIATAAVNPISLQLPFFRHENHAGRISLSPYI